MFPRNVDRLVRGRRSAFPADLPDVGIACDRVGRDRYPARTRDRLQNDIRHALGYDPLGGHVLVFVNRHKNQVKLIVWTRGGFTIVHKRLECGTFTFPERVTADAKSGDDVHEFAMLLEGSRSIARRPSPRSST